METSTHTTTPISAEDISEFEALTKELSDLADKTKEVASKRSAVTRRMSQGRPLREVADVTGLSLSRVYYVANEGKGRKRH